MSLRESLLRDIREVRTAYFLLGERLLDLEERVASLELGETTVEVSEPVEGQIGTPRSWGTGERAVSSHSGSASEQSYPASAATGVGNGEIQREAAIRTGRFFRLLLDNQLVGRSGRELVNLPNNFYVVIRDYQGLVTVAPVRVFESYPETARVVCGPGGSLGSSIFAGFHTRWEARLSVEEAGLEFPAYLD